MGKELILEQPRCLAFRSYEERPPNADEVLLRTICTGISHGTEMRQYHNNQVQKQWDETLRLFNGAYPRTYPVVLGYDNVSRVVAVGKNVTRIRPGSIVWTDLPHRETGLVSEDKAFKGLLFPAEEAETVPYHCIEAFIFSVRTRVALNAIHDASIVLGERVAVIGLGAVGLLALQMARLNGANEVFCIDLFPKRLELAACFGGLPLLAQKDPAYAIKQASGGVDVAIETSGSYAGLQTALRCCRIGGRVVTVSTYNGAGSALFLGEEWSKNRLTLHSSMSVNGCPSRRYPLWDKDRLDACTRQVLKQGIINTQSIITHRYPFEQALGAYQMIERQPGEVIQVLFQYEKERC